MKRRMAIFLCVVASFPVHLAAGPFDVLGAVVAAPLVLGAVVVGADLGQERRDREAYYLRQEYERDQNNKKYALRQLDEEYERVNQHVADAQGAIVRLGRTYETLSVQIISAEKEKEQWQHESQERVQRLALLRAQLNAGIQEYERTLAPLKDAHEQRMHAIEQESVQQLAMLQRDQEQEVHNCEQALAREDAALDLLCNQKRVLESRINMGNDQIHGAKRTLVDGIVRVIVSGHAQKRDVLEALTYVGGDEEILHAAEHARNASLLVALIVSNKFKPTDLTCPELESVPKSFFKAVRVQLAQADRGVLCEDVYCAWRQQLKKLGQRHFLCCSC